MDTVREMTPEEIQAGFKSSDMGVINGVIAGTIKAKLPEAPEATDEQQTVTTTIAAEPAGGTPASIPTIEAETETPTQEKAPEVSQTPSSGNEEIERVKRYAELVEKQKSEATEKYLKQLDAQRKQYETEKTAREELEAKLQKLQENMQTQSPETPSVETDETDEDEDFVSDYAKKNRQLIEEIKSQVGNTNPEILDKLKRIESEFEKKREIEAQMEKQREKEETERKLYNEIEDFQSTHKELQTSKSVKEINEEWSKFRKDIAFITKAKTVTELEAKISDYLSGGPTKELADENGISPVTDYDKFQVLVNLVDLKNGIEYDKNTGKEIKLTDSFGKPVNYASIDQAYKVSHYYDDLNNQRVNAYKDVKQKLESINDAAVTLNPSAITPTNEIASSSDDASIMDAYGKNMRAWLKDPEKYKLIKGVYERQGIPAPAFKGR